MKVAASDEIKTKLSYKPKVKPKLLLETQVLPLKIGEVKLKYKPPLCIIMNCLHPNTLSKGDFWRRHRLKGKDEGTIIMK